MCVASTKCGQPSDCASSHCFFSSSGGDGDDILLGQEYADEIWGNAGQDDLIGGHNVLHGKDAGDGKSTRIKPLLRIKKKTLSFVVHFYCYIVIHGGNDEDTIAGDNAEILRRVVKVGNSYPWDHDITWETYPAPFDKEVIREVRLFDDVDKVAGDDKLYGDHGNDQVNYPLVAQVDVR